MKPGMACAPMGAALLIGATAPSAAQDRCSPATDYAGWHPAAGQNWDYHSAGVTIIGAEHVRDPAHEQFARIAREFKAAQPTIAFFEGPDRGIGSDAADTIRRTGESGYLRYLAHEAGVPAHSLEPSPGKQMAELMQSFPADQVLLFFVTREAARLRDREGLKGPALDNAVATLLQRVRDLAARTQVTLPFDDLAGLDKTFSRYWPDRDWRTADAAWFSPLADDAATGGRFMAAINRADSGNRNRHLLQSLQDAVAAGQRPFVLIGRNHVPMLAPALDCMLRAAPAK